MRGNFFINDKLNKNMYKEFLILAWPAIAQGFLLDLLSSIDLAMAGQLGSGAQAAIGLVSQPKMIMLILARAMSISVTAVISRRFGQEKYYEMRNILKQAIFLIFFIYLILVSISLIFFRNIALVTGAKAEYLSMSVIYGRIIFISLIFNSLSMVINSALVGIGRTKVLFVSNVVGNICNCILNYLFIFGKLGFPKLGIFGVATATLIGSIITFLIILLNLQESSSLLKLDNKNWIPRKNTLGAIYKVTLGTLPEQIFERIGMYLYTVMVVNLGTIQLAVHHICMNLCDIFYSLAMGMSTATAATTGQMLGKDDVEKAVSYGRIGQRIGFIVAIIGFLVFSIFRGPIFSIFSKDPLAIEIGSKILLIVAIVSFPQTFSLVNSGVLKGAGDTKYVAKYSLIIIAILRPILTYILIFILDLGLYGAWISLLIDQSLRAIAASLRFKSRKWTTTVV